MATLRVNLVAADREVWTGEAKFVEARTTEGDIGILPGHTPILAALAAGRVLIRGAAGEEFHAEIDGGFMSVEHDTVVLVASDVTVHNADSSARRH